MYVKKEETPNDREAALLWNQNRGALHVSSGDFAADRFAAGFVRDNICEVFQLDDLA